MIVQNVLSSIQSIAIIVATIAAVYGINAWRKEFIFKRKLDVAEEALLLFYQCADNIKMIRNPFYAAGEGDSRKSNESETERETEIYNRAYVVRERYEKVRESFQKLNVIKYRFIVYFGEDKVRLFHEYNKILAKLIHASDALGRHYWIKETSCDSNMHERLLQETNKYESIIWPTNDNDEINKKLEEVIREAGEICKKFFK